MFLQTAFKRSAPTSAPDTGGSGGCLDAADVIDWDSVKPDDKTPVFQVSLLRPSGHEIPQVQYDADSRCGLSLPRAPHRGRPLPSPPTGLCPLTALHPNPLHPLCGQAHVHQGYALPSINSDMFHYLIGSCQNISVCMDPHTGCTLFVACWRQHPCALRLVNLMSLVVCELARSVIRASASLAVGSGFYPCHCRVVFCLRYLIEEVTYFSLSWARCLHSGPGFGPVIT